MKETVKTLRHLSPRDVSGSYTCMTMRKCFVPSGKMSAISPTLVRDQHRSDLQLYNEIYKLLFSDSMKRQRTLTTVEILAETK